jgi:hypothetical protein
MSKGYCFIVILLRIINSVRQRLLIGFDVAPDVAVTLMAGKLQGQNGRLLFRQACVGTYASAHVASPASSETRKPV